MLELAIYAAGFVGLVALLAWEHKAAVKKAW
jgi:hypothetical protein